MTISATSVCIHVKQRVDANRNGSKSSTTKEINKKGILLFEAGALSLSLKEVSIWGGNVFPRSQISTNFLIFSYSTKWSNT